MKITAFNPVILTNSSQEVLKVFEDLGFERHHTKTVISDDNATGFNLKYDDKFRVDVAQVDRFPKDMTVIRMNVDDFQEAYKFLTDRGFVNPQGNQITETGSSHGALLISPSGFGISLSQHIK